jgi:hypothetical protein
MPHDVPSKRSPRRWRRDGDANGWAFYRVHTSDRLLIKANEQNAYLFRFPDGRVSLDLEWIDIESIAQHVIAAYIAHVNKS